MDRGAWWLWGGKESDTTQRLNNSNTGSHADKLKDPTSSEKHCFLPLPGHSRLECYMQWNVLGFLLIKVFVVYCWLRFWAQPNSIQVGKLWIHPRANLCSSNLKTAMAPGWRRKCNPLQYSCLENPMDRAARWVTVHRVAKSRTHLSNFTMAPGRCLTLLYLAEDHFSKKSYTEQIQFTTRFRCFFFFLSFLSFFLPSFHFVSFHKMMSPLIAE